ncbi:MAG: hypothetical protein MR679_03605 [Bacteroidales bacterium]|nr:hypothetical protein [Bacteroidales bacterium]
MTKNNAPDTMIAIFAIVVSGALVGAFFCVGGQGVERGRHIVIDNEIVFRGIGARQ